MGKDLFSFGKARNIQAAMGPEGLVEEGQSGFFPVTPEEKPLKDFQGPVQTEKKHLALRCRPWGPLGRGRSERNVRDHLLNVLVWKAPKDLPCWKLSDVSPHPERSPHQGNPFCIHTLTSRKRFCLSCPTSNSLGWTQQFLSSNLRLGTL